MKLFLISICITFLLGVFTVDNAAALQCDFNYTVRRGDSLSKIAKQVYGRYSAYQRIFDYNPGVLESPSMLPVGVTLYIPCRKRGRSAGAKSVKRLPELVSADSGNLTILTGSEYPPYVDAGLPGGGFSFEVVERAMQKGSGKAEYRIDVVNDWASHLKTLLANGAYDLAFPWFKPDCSKINLLGEESAWRCKNLRYSKTMHEVVITFYTTSDKGERYKSVKDMFNAKICRPRGYFTHDLEAMGLKPPKIVRVAGTNPRDCFERLQKGDVDIVTLNADTSDKVIGRLGIQDQVAELIDFATIQTLHLVGMRSNPKTRVNLFRFDRGLKQLHKSGDFREIAKFHLSQ